MVTLFLFRSLDALPLSRVRRVANYISKLGVCVQLVSSSVLSVAFAPRRHPVRLRRVESFKVASDKVSFVRAAAGKRILSGEYRAHFADEARQ